MDTKYATNKLAITKEKKALTLCFCIFALNLSKSDKVFFKPLDFRRWAQAVQFHLLSISSVSYCFRIVLPLAPTGILIFRSVKFISCTRTTCLGILCVGFSHSN